MCVIFGAHVDERSPAYRAMDRYFWVGHLVANRFAMAASFDPLAGVTWPTHGRAHVHVDQEYGGVP